MRDKEQKIAGECYLKSRNIPTLILCGVSTALRGGDLMQGWSTTGSCKKSCQAYREQSCQIFARGSYIRVRFLIEGRVSHRKERKYEHHVKAVLSR